MTDIEVYFRDLNNWKKTQEKVYSAWMACVPAGMQFQNQVYSTVGMTNSDNDFVLTNMPGNFVISNYADIMQRFTWQDGSKLTANSLATHLKTLANGTKVFDWTKVVYVPRKDTVWALLMPAREFSNFNTPCGIVNSSAIRRHGLGDVILSPDAGGKPNLDKLKIENGFAFPYLYNMRNFPKLVNSAGTVQRPASLFKV